MPLLSGEVHYFHHRPEDWPRLLDSIRDLGFSMVSSYVPWGVHERAKGELDLKLIRSLASQS